MKYSNIFSSKKLFILNIATFGLYQIYWYYKNWVQIKEHTRGNFSPKLRTFGFIIPISGWFFLYDQFAAVFTLAKGKKCPLPISPVRLVLIYVLISFLAVMVPPWNFLYLLNALPLMQMQDMLNCYWRSEQQNLPEFRGFNRLEFIVAFLGFFIFISIISGFITS